MKLLILGATSCIAQEVAKKVLRDGGDVYLVARDSKKLEILLQDLKLRGKGKVAGSVFDLDKEENHSKIISMASEALGSIDTALIAHGILGDQEKAEQNYAEAFRILNTNFLSSVSLSQKVVNYFAGQKRGTLAVIGSVAGDRGRQSNYYYGASKAGLEAFLSGLRNKIYPRGIHVLTIIPGYVDTPMTAGYKKNFLFAKPDSVARGILNAIKQKKDVVYLPKFWWGIMWIIRSIPECLFKRLRL